MRDRVESVDGTLTLDSGPAGGHPGPGRSPAADRTGWLRCAPGRLGPGRRHASCSCVADVVVTAQYRPLLSETAVAVHGFPFVHGAVLGSSVMGAPIITRYDRHPIGWLLSIIGRLARSPC